MSLKAICFTFLLGSLTVSLSQKFDIPTDINPEEAASSIVEGAKMGAGVAESVIEESMTGAQKAVEVPIQIGADIVEKGIDVGKKMIGKGIAVGETFAKSAFGIGKKFAETKSS